MFNYCSECRRYYTMRVPHQCPVKRQPAKVVVWNWPPPWHRATSADAKIARKFRTVKTKALF